MTSTARKPLPFPPRTLHAGSDPALENAVNRAIRAAPRARDQKLVERVRREFSDLRGLSPTMAQARRLFHLAEDECFEIFTQLLLEGFLVLCPDDRYRLKTRPHR